MKPSWYPVTDARKAAAIMARKWREGHPTWRYENGVLWVMR